MVVHEILCWEVFYFVQFCLKLDKITSTFLKDLLAFSLMEMDEWESLDFLVVIAMLAVLPWLPVKSPRGNFQANCSTTWGILHYIIPSQTGA
jgi:hypothetical protein